MKITKTAITILLFMHIVGISSAQNPETKKFEKEKGKLSFPVCTIYSFNDYKCVKYEPVHIPYKNITFITDSAAEVRAIHDGKVYNVFTIEKEYAIVEKYGDYYITYYPLAKPRLKKGDDILQGQPLGKISSPDTPNEINILMSKETKFIEPYKWFKW